MVGDDQRARIARSGWRAGRWTVGCAVLFAGSLFCAGFFLALLAGDGISDAAITAAAMGGVGLAGAGLFGFFGALDERKRRRIVQEVRTRLEHRGAVSDEAACESVPFADRSFFLEVRRAAAEFLGVPPEWLRATDSLPEDYRSLDYGWWDLEQEVFDRIQPRRELSDPDLFTDGTMPETLADLAVHLRRMIEIAEKGDPPVDRGATESGSPAHGQHSE